MSAGGDTCPLTMGAAMAVFTVLAWGNVAAAASKLIPALNHLQFKIGAEPLGRHRALASAPLGAA